MRSLLEALLVLALYLLPLSAFPKSGATELPKACDRSLRRSTATEVVNPLRSFNQQGLASCWAYAATVVLENYIAVSRHIELPLSADAIVLGYILDAVDRIPTRHNAHLANLTGWQDLESLQNGGSSVNRALDLWRRIGFYTTGHYHFRLREPTAQPALQRVIHSVETLARSLDTEPGAHNQRWFLDWARDRVAIHFGPLPEELSPAFMDATDPQVLARRVMGPNWTEELQWQRIFTRSDGLKLLPSNWLATEKLRDEDRPNPLRQWWARRKLLASLDQLAASPHKLEEVSQLMRRVIDQKKVLHASLTWMKEYVASQDGEVTNDLSRVEKIATLAEGLIKVHAVVVNGYRLDAGGNISHWRIQEGTLPGYDNKGGHWITVEHFNRRLMRVNLLHETKDRAMPSGGAAPALADIAEVSL